MTRIAVDQLLIQRVTKGTLAIDLGGTVIGTEPCPGVYVKTRNVDPTGVRTISVSEFRAKCHKVVDEVADNGEEIVITKNGQPVSRLIPYRWMPDTLFGIDRGKLEILVDIEAPLARRRRPTRGAPGR